MTKGGININASGPLSLHGDLVAGDKSTNVYVGTNAVGSVADLTRKMEAALEKIGVDLASDFQKAQSTPDGVVELRAKLKKMREGADAAVRITIQDAIRVSLDLEIAMVDEADANG